MDGSLLNLFKILFIEFFGEDKTIYSLIKNKFIITDTYIGWMWTCLVLDPEAVYSSVNWMDVTDVVWLVLDWSSQHLLLWIQNTGTVFQYLYILIYK